MMKHHGKFLRPLLFCCCVVLLLGACSSQEEAKPKPQAKKLAPQRVVELARQIHQDLDQITQAALQYQADKGSEPANLRMLKDYLAVAPKPPVEVRDQSFTFEWDYFITGALDDMGGPTKAPDTVVFLEGVTEQVCFGFNSSYSNVGGRAWDLLGKKARPNAESWCENGGNPYRIIRVVNLR